MSAGFLFLEKQKRGFANSTVFFGENRYSLYLESPQKAFVLKAWSPFSGAIGKWGLIGRPKFIEGVLERSLRSQATAPHTPATVHCVSVGPKQQAK